jgi:hypothetical protein
MKTCGGVEVRFHTFLTSTLDGGECSASRSPPPPQTESLRLTVQHGRSGHGNVEKDPCYCRESNPSSQAPSPLLY